MRRSWPAARCCGGELRRWRGCRGGLRVWVSVVSLGQRLGGEKVGRSNTAETAAMKSEFGCDLENRNQLNLPFDETPPQQRKPVN